MTGIPSRGWFTPSAVDELFNAECDLEEAVATEALALARRDRLSRRALIAPRGSAAVIAYNEASRAVAASVEARKAAEARLEALQSGEAS